MGAPGPVGPGPVWMDNGFPPRTFPFETARDGGAGVTEPVTGGPSPRRRRRGPWVAAAAALIALLLLGAGLALANRDDDDSGDLAVDDTSTTVAAPDTSVPTSDPGTTLESTTSTEAVSTTVAPDTSTVAAGVLETSTNELAIPRVNAADGPGTARLTLRNSGPGALSYTTQPSTAGVSATPARGTISPGGMVELVVSLDGTRVPAEGPFTATLTVGGTGGTRTVQVTSLVGRPPAIADDSGEPCSTTNVPCSRQIRLAPPTFGVSSPCNTPFAYSVNVADQSRIQSVRAVARRGLANADAPLLKRDQQSGTNGVFESAPMIAVPAGLTLRFFIEATDQLGFSIRLAEQTIVC